jgi:hypothetical protein
MADEFAFEISVNVFDEDTKETILKRLAGKLHTLPKYLLNVELVGEAFVEDENSGVKQFTFRVIDLLTLLKNVELSSEYILTPQILKLIQAQKDVNFTNDIVIPYFWFRIENFLLRSSSKDIDFNMAFLIVADNFRNYETFMANKISKSQLEKEKMKERIEKIEGEIEANKKESDAREKLLNTFFFKKKCVPYTAFQKTKATYLLQTSVQNVDIMSVFDLMNLTKLVNVAFIYDFYKVYNDANLADDHGVFFNEKKYNEVVVKEKRNKDEITILYDDKDIIRLYNNPETNTLEIFLEIEIENTSRKDIIIEELKRVLHGLEITLEYEFSISGYFTIPNFSINSKIFLHMAMNNLYFYKIFFDESVKAYKQKRMLGGFFEPKSDCLKSDFVWFNILPKKDLRLEKKSGKKYLFINVKNAKNEAVVRQLQNYFCRIFSIYLEEKDKIQKIYDFFGLVEDKFEEQEDDDGEEEENVEFRGGETKDGKPRLMRLAKNIFSSGYGRRCMNQVQVISEEKANELISEGKKDSVLRYPITDAEAAIEPRRWYGCLEPKYPYIDTRLINDIEKSKIKYVPCCYNTKQPRKEKVEDEEDILCSSAIDKILPQTHIIETRMALGFKQIGYLKAFPNIDYIFNKAIRVQKGNNVFKRYGMDPTELSFLQCVLTALGRHNEPELNTCLKRKKRLLEAVESISQSLSVDCGWQSFYGCSSIDEIREEIRKKNVYFSPELFTSILEDYFHCKIYVFNDSTIRAPKFIQNFVLNERSLKENTIFILEHTGTRSDRFPYPRCELLFESSSDSDRRMVFSDSTSQYPKFISKIFEISFTSFSARAQTMTYAFEDFFYSNLPTYQIINGYGKVSAFVFGYSPSSSSSERSFFLLYSDTPMPPFHVESVKSSSQFELQHATKDELLKVLPTYFTLKKTHETYFEVQSKEYPQNVYKIPFRTKRKIPQIPLGNTNSSLQKFVMNQQVAYVLQEFAKYILSKYLLEKQITGEITEAHIAQCIRENMIRRDDFQYGYNSLPETFTAIAGGFIEDSKLIINSAELMRRIAYLLFLERYQVKDYHKKIVVSRLHIDALNFSTHIPSQTVMKGDLKFFQKFIKNCNVFHKFSRYVQPISSDNTSTPYIFNNLKIENGPYLAVSVRTDSAVQSLLYFWNKFKIISVKELEPGTENPFENVDLYAFLSQFQIVLTKENQTLPLQLNKVLNYKNQVLVVLLKL